MKIAFSITMIALLVFCGSFPPIALAQNPPANPQSSAQAGSPAKGLNMYAFPRSGQSPDQQLKDENACYAAAKQQTGIDPQAPPPAGKTQEQKAAEQKAAADAAKTPKGGRARGAARGAAGGAAVGAIAGDAGTGAAAGAVVGTMKGGMDQRKASAQAQKQAAASTASAQQKEDEQLKQAQASKLDTFKRAFSACMDAKGYSIK